MAKIIAFTNQAGGVGKSTSVVNIAAFLSKNYKVLVVDADGQQTATMNLGINPYQLDYSPVRRRLSLLLSVVCDYDLSVRQILDLRV